MNDFTKQIFIRAFVGSAKYRLWMGVLIVLMAAGVSAYIYQLTTGMIVTNMRDQVSWGFYIANFTFLVGVAAAAVLLVIPAYIYQFKPIKEIVLFGEMIAVVAILMCLMFIMADLGKPLVAFHLFPWPIGQMNFPASLLTWDVIVLNGYLALNLSVVLYVLYTHAMGREYSMKVMWPIIILSIPWAVSIHTVTAFLYNGLSARPFWNASILAPRFIASALCSGPALMLIIFQIARKVTKIQISNEAIFKVTELMAYAMGFNLYLLAAELFKEFYSGSIHLAPMKYLFFGLEHEGHKLQNLVPFMWTSLIFNITAFIIFLRAKTRENFRTLNIGLVLVIIGVYIEKGMGLIVPGFIPDTLGEIYQYLPSWVELTIAVGIWSFGALTYTLFLRIAVPIYMGELTVKTTAKP